MRTSYKRFLKILTDELKLEYHHPWFQSSSPKNILFTNKRPYLKILGIFSDVDKKSGYITMYFGIKVPKHYLTQEVELMLKLGEYNYRIE